MSLIDKLPDSIAVRFSKDERTIDLLKVVKRTRKCIRSSEGLSRNGEIFDYNIREIKKLLSGYEYSRFGPYFRKSLEELQLEEKFALGYNLNQSL